MLQSRACFPAFFRSSESEFVSSRESFSARRFCMRGHICKIFSHGDLLFRHLDFIITSIASAATVLTRHYMTFLRGFALKIRRRRVEPHHYYRRRRRDYSACNTTSCRCRRLLGLQRKSQIIINSLHFNYAALERCQNVPTLEDDIPISQQPAKITTYRATRQFCRRRYRNNAMTI